MLSRIERRSSRAWALRVLGGRGRSRPEGRPRGRAAAGFPGHFDAALVDRYGSDQGERQLGASRADQPAQAHHLAGPDLEADVSYVVGDEAAYRQHDLAGLTGVAHEHVGQVASDHHPHELGVVGLRHQPVPDVVAVAQHRHPVRDGEDLGHPVRHVDDGDAVVA
jgi:hypothetical protein